MNLFPKCAICAKMKTVLVVFLCLFVQNVPVTLSADTCPTSPQTVYIDETKVAAVIATVSLPSSAELVSFTTDNDREKSYFTVSLEDSALTLSTTDAYQNLGEDVDAGQQIIVITLSVSLKCDEGTVIMPIIVRITDTFSHDPQFSQASYSYSIPMPIMPKTDITRFGQEIVITDINFSNVGITLSISPDDFNLNVTTSDSKNFKAVFSTKSIIRLSEDKTYSLTAVDSGGKSTSVPLIIAVDPAAGLDSPAFSQAYYLFDYSTEGTGSLTPKSGDIVISSDKPNEANFEITGENANNFNVYFNNDTNTFQLSVSSSLSSDISGQIVLALSYTTDSTTNAVLLIDVVRNDAVPKFSSDYYTGTYDIDTNKVTWAQQIAVSNATAVELSEGQSSLFTIDPDTYDIQPNTKLSESDFDENLNIILKATATSASNNESQALMVISLQIVAEEELRFDSAYYSATYTKQDDSGIVTLQTDIGFSDITDYTGIDIQVDDAYSSNFKVELDSLKWKVSVSVPLDDTVLSKSTELAIPIMATKSGSDSAASAVIILTLPDWVELKFGKVYYTASYVKGTDNDSVQLDHEIKIAGAEAADISITFEDYDANFELEQSASSSYTVKVKVNLNASTLASASPLLLTIVATTAENVASAVLILKLPSEPATLEFVEQHYTGNYTVDADSNGKVVLEEANGIQVAKSKEDMTVAFSFEGYDENFALEFKEDSSTYDVNVLTNLNSDVLESNSQLIITITAYSTEANLSSYAVLVLNLPVSETPSIEFEKKHYSANYTLNSEDKAIVSVIDGPIKINNDDNVELKFSLEGFDNNFELVFDEASSTYGINVVSPLDSTIVTSSQLIITITAFTSDKSLTSEAVLILNLPDTASSIAFEKKHYNAQYTVDAEDSKATITVTDGPIKISKSDDVELQFSFEGYEQNFNLTFDEASSSYAINVLSPLSDSILAKQSQLIITVTAFTSDKSLTSEAVLILNLPDTASSIAFEKKHYNAQYTVDAEDSKATITVTDGPIKISKSDDVELQFSFEGYEQNFNLTFDEASSSYAINVLSPLSDSILAKQSQLIITVTAFTSDKSLTSEAVLIVDLPDTASSIAFEKKHYNAQYTVDAEDSKATITVTDGPIKISKSDDVELQFSFEGYEQNFNLTFDEASSSYAINVLSPLSDSLLAKQSQLIITVTAFTSDKSLTSEAVLILNLPDTASSIAFKKKHYNAQYTVDAEDSKATITVTDGPIKISKSDDVELQFSFEGYEQNFNLTFDEASSSYAINVLSPLSDSILAKQSQLIITVTAFTSDKSLTSEAVLILNLPDTASSIAFEKKHYNAQYTVDADDSKATITLTDGPIKISKSDDVELQFSFEGYEQNFNLTFDEASSSYAINVLSPLSDSILAKQSQLIITVTAFTSDKSLTSDSVLVLNLPSSSTPSIVFEKTYYSANYTVDSESKATIAITDGPIKIYNAEAIELQFSFEGYEKYFALDSDSSGTYTITVLQNLDDSLLESSGPLIITVTASAVDGDATGQTVLILNLPQNIVSLSFVEQYYTAFYQVDSEPTVRLDEAIALLGEGYTNIQFSFEEYGENFQLESSSSGDSYNIKVATPLSDTVLSLNTQLIVIVTATDEASSVSASTVLVVKLPSFNENAFESEHYLAEYKSSTETGGTDEVNLLQSTIKVTAAMYTQISFIGYDPNFAASCDSTSLECSISVKSNLNASILAANDDLLVTLVASNADKTSIGKAVLLLSLPSKISTFSFSSQHYSASYSIQEADEELSTVTLEGRIMVQGAEASEVDLVLDGDYSVYFGLTLLHDSSAWNLNVIKNLEASILNGTSSLVTSLTAKKQSDGEPDYARATLIITLPDALTVSFSQPQYYGEYTRDDPQNPEVVLDSDSLIDISDSTNNAIVLDSFTENFAIELNSDSAWTVQVKNPLDSSILSQYSELKLLLTITKVGVNYGSAALTIRLPAFSFSEDVYSGSYSLDENDVGILSGVTDIIIDNADPSLVDVHVADYSNYFKTEVANDKWTLTLTNSLPLPLPDAIVTNLQATRKSDNKILATSTLHISMPSEDVANAPTFKIFTYYGTYQNSDPPLVELTELITLDDDDSQTQVYIETSSDYASNFNLDSEDSSNQYSVSIVTPLPQEVLDAETNIVFTLVARSTGGNHGYATLVISLPKQLRNTSVQLEDEEQILFTGTYNNGVFTSPSISLKTNSTNDEDISVKISNDLGIEDSYFGYTYSNQVLTVHVGKLPEEIVNSTSVVPLKLAITDRNTQDTVYAVVNVAITGEGGDGNDATGGGASRVGLIVAVAMLAAILLLVLLAIFLFWYFKLRNTHYAEMLNEEVEAPAKTTTFTKNEKKLSIPVSNSPSRRPTGLPIGITNFVPEESSSDQDVSVTTDAPSFTEPEKRVEFDDNVENIDLQEEDGDDETSGGLISVADRRPTKFVFAHSPIEEGILHFPDDERRESSDYSEISRDMDEGERKKSVAFNENVERMHIDPIADDEEAGSEDEETEPSNYKTEAELQIKDEEKQLPSQIF